MEEMEAKQALKHPGKHGSKKHLETATSGVPGGHGSHKQLTSAHSRTQKHLDTGDLELVRDNPEAAAENGTADSFQNVSVVFDKPQATDVNGSQKVEVGDQHGFLDNHGQADDGSDLDTELAAVCHRGSRRHSGLRSNKVAPMGSQRASMRDRGSGEIIEKGMVLPFEPLCLTFRNMDYYVDMPKAMDTTDPEKIGPRPAEVDGVTMLQLLKDCSGVFQPGVLTALVGSSGAGKTTLMDVLAGRKTTGKITGDIRISGHEKEQQSFARISGYVEQFDIHSPFTTVGEALWFSSRLRFVKSVDDQTVREFIEEIEDLVELGNLRNSLVGTPGRDGLSVEQRKRLTIAVELVANPSIIFMDEPTSGLDARAAAIVMRTVRNTVDTGRTVVCTIHQPSIDIFEAFDDLLLMKVGGHIIYHGPLGANSIKLVEYFEGLPAVPKLKEGLNPATWMLQISTPGMEKVIGVDFAVAYKSSATYRHVQEDIERLEVAPQGSQPLHFTSQFAQSQWVQFYELLRRNFISYARNSSYNGTRFIFGAVLALLFGSILWQIGQKRSTVQDVGNILGALYLSMLFLAFINSMSVQKPIDYERSVSYRETAAGMYSSLPFALSACTVEVPYILAQSILFCIISYWMIGFEASVTKYFWYQFMIFITLFLMTNYGIMSVYATPNIVAASVSSSMFFGLWNLYAGFIIAPGNMPVYFKWYRYLNPIYWSLYGIIVSQLGDVSELVDLGPGITPVPVSQYLEDQFGYKHNFIGYVALIMIGYGLAFAVIGVFALQFLKYQKR